MATLKNVFRVLLANIANFGSSFIIGFILPSILTVTAYGHYKQFSLYFTFVHIFSFGYNDGILVKYAGKNVSDIESEIINNEHNFINIFSVLISLMVCVAGVILNSWIIVCFGISIFLLLVNTFHQNFNQAIGEFRQYSSANYIRALVFSVLLVFLIVFYRDSDNYIAYIMPLLMSYVVMLAYNIAIFFKKFSFKKTVDIQSNINKFAVGLPILYGNMGNQFIALSGNIATNWFFPIEIFALYSFQNSVLNVLLLIINAVGTVFFNVFAKKSGEDITNLFINLFALIGMVFCFSFFPLRFIIYRFLPKYTLSIEMLCFTMLSIPAIFIINIIMINLYKVRNLGRVYLVDSIIFAGVSIVMTVCVGYFTQNTSVIALATSLVYYMWLLYMVSVRFQEITFKRKTMYTLLSFIIVFIFSSLYLSDIVGSIFYLIYCLLLLALFNDEIKTAFRLLSLNKRNVGGRK